MGVTAADGVGEARVDGLPVQFAGPGLALLGFLLAILIHNPSWRWFTRGWRGWDKLWPAIVALALLLAGYGVVLVVYARLHGVVTTVVLMAVVGALVYGATWVGERVRRSPPAPDRLRLPANWRDTGGAGVAERVQPAEPEHRAPVPRPRRRRRRPAIQTPADALRESMARRW